MVLTNLYVSIYAEEYLCKKSLLLPINKAITAKFAESAISSTFKIRGDRSRDTKVTELLSFHFCMLNVKWSYKLKNSHIVTCIRLVHSEFGGLLFEK